MDQWFGGVLIEFETALELVSNRCKPLPLEEVPLTKALGRYLEQDAGAIVDSPPFDNSAVDGYALSAGPGPWRFVGELAAGAARALSLEEGEAASIYTGAPVPSGTEAIAMIENCDLSEPGFVRASATGDYIRAQGRDFAAGDHLARAGDLVTPALAGLLASAGHSRVVVPRLPTVSLLTTGNELVDPGASLAFGQVYNSNGVALACALRSLGLEPHHQHLEDSLARLKEALSTQVALADVVVVCGGTSVGRHDHLRAACAAAGVEEVFWRVNVRPGKPLYFGCTGDRLIFGLPGNPVSALVTYLLFVRPALLALLGGIGPLFSPVQAELLEALDKESDRTEFVRGRLSTNSGQLRVSPSLDRASHLLVGTGHADALILFPSSADRLSPGELVEVLPIRWGVDAT